MIVLLLFACPDDDATDKVGTIDTSSNACDRVHGATGILVYEDNGDTVHFPTDAPDKETQTTSTAGPLGDGTSWMAMFGPRVMVSDDGGCNWDFNGSGLPSTGRWQLLAAGDRVYAFDELSSQAGYSTDAGKNWNAADVGGTFLAQPVAGATSTTVRGIQSRGVVTTEDGGVNWSVTATLPAVDVVAGDVFAGDTERIFVVTPTGGYTSRTGGASWDDISAAVTTDSFVPSRAAIHPDNADVLFMSGEDDDGPVIVRSTDGGASWDDAASIRQVDLDAGAPLWPVPGSGTTVLSGWATRDDDYGMNLYVVSTTGIHTSHVGSYWGLNDVSFRDDGAWIAAVHGVE